MDTPEHEINPYITKDRGELCITDAGYELLKELVTDTKSDVYAFTAKAPPKMIGAAMARLSRNQHDLRKTYLNEFAVDESEADNLIRRVVTAFGDDSVQQLVSISVVVENASNLLTKKLEWGRLLSYLEQSTRYIFFDKKRDGRYRYYIPDNLPDTLRSVYVMYMDKIFDSYSEMVRGLTEYIRKKSAHLEKNMGKAAWLAATRAQACDAIRPVLPASTTSTVGIVGSTQGFDNLIMRLHSEHLHECVATGQNILAEVKKIVPAFFERTDMPERGLTVSNYIKNTRALMRKTADWCLPRHLDTKIERVVLVDYWPIDELTLVPEMLFAESDLPIDIIQEKVSGWSTAEKESIFRYYIGERLNRRHKPGRALEKAHYEWQITGDYGTFRDLQRHRMVDQMEWQRLTPYYGYSTPHIVSEAGMEKIFASCFDQSEILFYMLLDAGLEEESQYATLLGHRMRYRFTENARAAFHIHELRTGPAGHQGYRAIVNEMHEKLSKVHPLIGEAMRFVNKDDDPELTRKASEMVTQSKLAKLARK